MTNNRTQRLRARSRRRSRRIQLEALEPRCLLAAQPIVTEFLASNDDNLLDGNGASSDWIEIYNAGDAPVDLLGYSLTDEPAEPNKFVLPTKTLAAGQYLVIFASGDNAPDGAGNIHTNFRLAAGGEYVGLFDPQGTLVSEFGIDGTAFPQQIEDVSFGLDVSDGDYVTGSQRYFVQPTPGSLNTPHAADLAPMVTDVTQPTTAAVAGQDIIVTARPFAVGTSIRHIMMRARVNYGDEVSISMTDVGIGQDAVAGDGIYTATIPASLFDEGDMVRWRVVVAGMSGLVGTGPAFLDPLKSPEYFGTMVADSSVDTPLPVVYWFQDGSRGSVFYDGLFYDNILIRTRGWSSNNSPKKNLKFDFNPGHRFQLDPNFPLMDEINLNNTYYDQADVRATLSSEVFVAAGTPAPISFPVQTRRNGEFWSLSILVEQIDAIFLERNGIDPNGALYKADGVHGMDPDKNLDAFRKQTREFEGKEDLQELVDNVDPELPQAQRARYLYDNVDVFSVINYLAANSVIHNVDHPTKNHYLYRDTEGTGKWSFLPYDLDLTFGKNGANTPDIESYEADVTDQSSSKYPNSHPLFGGDEYPRFSNPDVWNRLIDAVLDTPELREIYLRRLRSVMDLTLQNPETPASELTLEARIAELLPLIQADWTQDDARWIEAPQTDKDRGTDWGEDLPLAVHMQRIVDRYLEPRRVHLYETHNIANAGTEFFLLQTQDPVRYLVPSGQISGWESLAYDDSGWDVGGQGIGYDRNTGYDSLIQTDLESDMYGSRSHVYTRASFEISSQDQLDQITNLFLSMRYDDGFIAYLNGVEVARDSGTLGSGLTATTSSHEATGQDRVQLSNSAIASLNVGDNVLAVHGINVQATSSDMLLRFELTVSDGGDPEVAGIPDQQVGNPSIHFDETDFDANPISGIEGQEYLRLNNPNDTAVDVSGWRLAGGVDMVFRPGTVIPAGRQLYAVSDVVEFLSRNAGPSGNQHLLTHGNYSGQLGFSGETVQLIATDGVVVDTLQIATTEGTDLQRFLRITEINYNPPTTTGAEEFIEFTNISSGGNSVTLDLSGATIADGPSVPFVFPGGTSLGPGQRLVVVKDTGAFQTYYPGVSPAQIAGQYAGSLSNGGERLRVEDAGGNTVLDLRYDDSDMWSVAADGAGASLVLVDAVDTPFEQLGKYYSWRGSAEFGGTPGAASVPSVGVVINEVLAHTDLPAVDAIELFNPTNDDIDVGGWWLSDSGSQLLKYEIPAGTTLGAREYLVFDETDFNTLPNAFALNAAGDKVFLVRPDGSGGLAFVDQVEFGASINGQSFGRVAAVSGRFSPLTSPTLGAVNSAAHVGMVVISEVNYHPQVPTPTAQAAFQAIAGSGALLIDSDLEFMELHNSTTSPVSLMGWRLRGEGDFDFADDTTLVGGATLVVVSFDPTEDAARMAGFIEHYGLAGRSVDIVGGYDAKLSNGFARLELERPDASNPLITTYVTADEVLYDDLAPWPIRTDVGGTVLDVDGGGATLERSGPTLYGNDSTSWHAAAPTPGFVDFVPSIPGDYSGNGTVEQADLDLVLLNWGGLGTPAPNGWLNDLPDARIDQNELDRVLLDWGHSGSAPVSQAAASPTATLVSHQSLETWWDSPKSHPLGPRRDIARDQVMREFALDELAPWQGRRWNGP